MLCVASRRVLGVTVCVGCPRPYQETGASGKAAPKKKGQLMTESVGAQFKCVTVLCPVADRGEGLTVTDTLTQCRTMCREAVGSGRV